MDASKDIKDCCTHLKEAWPLIKQEFEYMFPGWEISLDYTHRPPELQFQLYKKGRKLNIKLNEWEIIDRSQVVTYADGYKKISKHNFYPSHALDVKLRTPQKDITWTVRNKETGFILDQWAVLPVLAERHGLTNGGVWKKIQDWPHFQCEKCDEPLD